MKMNILCAERIVEMDVTFKHMTDIPNIDRDEHGMTLYGKETKEGLLYYVVIDTDTVDAIRCMDTPSIQLTTTELFQLGVAYGSFSIGEIDQGIHCILPVTDVDTGAKSNEVFRDLFDLHINYVEGSDGKDYMRCIRVWCAYYNIKVGI